MGVPLFFFSFFFLIAGLVTFRRLFLRFFFFRSFFFPVRTWARRPTNQRHGRRMLFGGKKEQNSADANREDRENGDRGFVRFRNRWSGMISPEAEREREREREHRIEED